MYPKRIAFIVEHYEGFVGSPDLVVETVHVSALDAMTALQKATELVGIWLLNPEKDTLTNPQYANPDMSTCCDFWYAYPAEGTNQPGYH